MHVNLIPEEKQEKDEIKKVPQNNKRRISAFKRSKVGS